MVEFTPLEREVWVLTTEGESLAQLGSHEARVFEAIPKDGGIEATELTVFPFYHKIFLDAKKIVFGRIG